MHISWDAEKFFYVEGHMELKQDLSTTLVQVADAIAKGRAMLTPEVDAKIIAFLNKLDDDANLGLLLAFVQKVKPDATKEILLGWIADAINVLTQASTLIVSGDAEKIENGLRKAAERKVILALVEKML